MIFNGRLSCMIPGNFVAWVVYNTPDEVGKSVAIPRDHTVIGAERAIKEIGITVDHKGGIFFPEISGADKLESAVFEIEKTARKNFEVIKYVGELGTKTTHTLTLK